MFFLLLNNVTQWLLELKKIELLYFHTNRCGKIPSIILQFSSAIRSWYNQVRTVCVQE
jgi:hypothetical protein